MIDDEIRTLPVIDDENRPFWDAARQGELRMQACVACGHIRFPIGPLCPICLSPDADWRRLSGQGAVFASIVYHQAFHPVWSSATPYNVVMVQLDEGPRMYSNVIDVAPDSIVIGDRLEVVFTPVTDDIHLPRFRRLGGAATD